MSDEIDHLDWEVEQGWVEFPVDPPLDVKAGDYVYLAIGRPEPAHSPLRLAIGTAFIVALVASFWFLAIYGLYCLVRR